MTFQTVASELEKHARSIDACIGVIDLAKGASGYVKMGNDAYGELSAWLPPILHGKHSTVDKLMGRAKQVLTDDAATMRAMAEDFRHHDGKNAEAIARAGAHEK
ncbi:MAG TPA: hypothetical protein VE172_06670 [Stackebrandtia sp.]|jgi:hypothetical protein|uniref:hypothetical protein n=1 Tax=Stackebrandtia sp. TaxID=2023065 RepID=UPI002D54F2A1|nr:hypothetical protein [Stackebrandtia sp.]HZE38481.1 hypothetical protein [Stackebrandtia sp.]